MGCQWMECVAGTGDLTWANISGDLITLSVRLGAYLRFCVPVYLFAISFPGNVSKS